MKVFVVLLTALCALQQASAQTATAEDSVKAAVNKLFTGMKTADASLVQASFAESAILQTIGRSKEGQILIQNESVQDFAKSIASLKAGAADERIEFAVVKIDGPLASVWTPYKFYYEGKFSHCGANSFQLVRIHNEWKIQYLIDTRRRQGCE